MNNVSYADMKELEKQYQGKNLDIVSNKIKNGYPVQYIIGYVNFCSNKIFVKENVLIPRYETEFLVDLIFRELNHNFTGNILDIGTGTGCIAISLAKIFKNSNIEGIDVNQDAIDLSNKNKEINEVTNVSFIKKDMEDIKNFDNYDVIVSNPPYVSYNEEVGLETSYEPKNAIFAPDDGLYFYKLIINKIKETNNKPNYVFFEIGMNQSKNISEICLKEITNYEVFIIKDLSGKDRYIKLILNK